MASNAARSAVARSPEPAWHDERPAQLTGAVEHVEQILLLLRQGEVVDEGHARRHIGGPLGREAQQRIDLVIDDPVLRDRGPGAAIASSSPRSSASRCSLLPG